MQKGKRMSRKSSRRQFSRNANKTHMFNLGGRPLRGGIRL